jgi:hypothetical protein
MKLSELSTAEVSVNEKIPVKLWLRLIKKFIALGETA